jgi:hypothetical protein
MDQGDFSRRAAAPLMRAGSREETTTDMRGTVHVCGELKAPVKPGSERRCSELQDLGEVGMWGFQFTYKVSP